MATAEENLFGTFQKHIEDMRALTLCKICIKPFYEPFILACGHTYCYSCLSSWFSGPHNRGKPKNCPDCRAIVRVEPAPNYLLRDMVHMFINRAELLPEDETVHEHLQAKEDETKSLADDRSGPGLFKGTFRRDANLRRRGRFHFQDPMPLPQHARGLTAIRDTQDGVTRCPRCTWELEEGECNQCGWQESEDSGDDSGASSDSSGIEYGRLPSETDEERRIRQMNEVLNFNIRDDPLWSGTDSSDSEDGGEDLHGFIEDDEDDNEDDLPDELDIDDDDDSVQTVTDYPHIHDDDGSDDEMNGYGYGDNEIVARPAPRRARNVIEDDTEGSSSDSAETSSIDSDTEGNTTVDDDSSVREITPPQPTTRVNRRRPVIDDDSDEDSEKSQTPDTRPPQNSAVRRQRLHQRRANGQTHNSQHQPPNPQIMITNHSQRGRGYGVGRGIPTARRSRPYNTTRVY